MDRYIEKVQSRPKVMRGRWWQLLVIIGLQIFVLMLAPDERTLGAGIKPVYLHVSLTWTGMLLLVLAGLFGLLLIIKPSAGLSTWLQMLYVTGIGFYLVGFLVSMVASLVNWGGIPFQEPRIRGALNVLVSGIAAWVLIELASNYRLKGLSTLIPLAFMLLSGRSSRLVLHPDNPVASSPLGIKTTFLTMFALALLLSFWVLWFQWEKNWDRE